MSDSVAAIEQREEAEAAAAAAQEPVEAAAAAKKRKKSKKKKKKKAAASSSAPAGELKEEQKKKPVEATQMLLDEAMNPPSVDGLVGKALMDAEIRQSLARRMLVLVHASRAVFQVARKHAGKSGRGTIAWYFPGVDDAVVGGGADGKPTGGQKEALHYLSADQVAATEHAQAEHFIRIYDPKATFTVLVAVRSGDGRDSLMRSIVFGRNAHMDPVLAASRDELVAAVPTITTRMPDGSTVEVEVASRRKFCDALACNRYEAAAGEFSKCGRCADAVYCSRDCQRTDWRRHKFECKTLAAAALEASKIK